MIDIMLGVFGIDDLAMILGAVAAAGSLSSMGYAAAQGTPQPPNSLADARKVSKVQGQATAEDRALAAAEEQGGTGVKPGYSKTTKSDVDRQKLQSRISSLDKWIAAGKAPQGSKSTVDQMKTARANLATQLSAIPEGGGTVYTDRKGNIVPESQATLNFQGYGTADIEGELAGKISDIQTELGAKYGQQFAGLATDEARQADPLGFQARDLEAQMLQDRKTPVNPLAQPLVDQTDSQLKAGSGLDDMSRELLDNAVARANADRAGGTSSDAVAGQMSTGMEGAARRQAGISKAQALLNSGATPEAITRRQQEQAIADEASFAGGQTPESQFSNLSAAAQGATPFYPGQPLPSQPNNAGAAGSPYSVAGWQTQLKNQSQQGNWLSGISAILGQVGGSMVKGTGG